MASTLLDAVEATLAQVSDNVTVTPAFRENRFVEYETVASTDSMASTPRFGHSNDFSMLFVKDDNYQAQQDYISGLVCVGCFVIALFVAWSLLLIVFKVWGSCCGSPVPGYLAGRPFTLRDEEPTKDRQTQWRRQSATKRIIFMIAGFVVFIFSILLVTKGFQEVEETRSTAAVSLDDVRGLLNDASSLAEDLKDVGISAIDLRDGLVEELSKDRLCPNNPGFTIEDDIGQAINETAGTAISLLTQLGEFATNEIQTMEDGLDQAYSVINTIDVQLESVSEKEWVGVAFVLPLVLLTSLLMTGSMAAWFNVISECYTFFLSWLIQPLFIAWIVFSYILCGVLAISASANADACSGGGDQTPEGTILESLQNAGYSDTTFEFEIARFYLRQCTAESEVDPFLFLREHQAELTTTNNIVEKLTDLIVKVNIDTLSFQCGRDFEPLTKSLDAMLVLLSALDQAAIDGLQLLSCDRIIPIYAQVVYTGACNHSVTAFTWMFSSLLVISTFGMIMIMLRASYHSDIMIADSTDDDNDLYVVVKPTRPRRQLDYGHDDDQSGSDDFQRREFNPQWPGTTSDSGSVYTDGNGELHVIEMDPSELYRQNPRKPTLFEYEEASYDSRGKPKPSAPYEYKA